MKKHFSLIFACLLILSGCASDAPLAQPPSPVVAGHAPPVIAALKGPTAMGLVKLMSDDETRGQYSFTIAGSADEITPGLLRGDIQMAAVPANLAAVLYNNTDGGVRVLAVNTLGVLYIVENGDDINSVEDLRGKTILSAGKGATPEYALNFMLEQNGLDPQRDVIIDFKSEHSECAALLNAKDNAIAMLPQPFVTAAQMKNERLRVALDLNQEWESAHQTPLSLITGVLVARTDFIEQNPETVAAFLAEYKASVDYVTDPQYIESAAGLIEQYDIVAAAIALHAIPQCNITLITGEEMRARLGGYLSVLHNQNPKAVGGALPDEDFYFV